MFVRKSCQCIMKKLFFDGETDRRIPRQSNIELLRIIAMLLIVAHHFSLYSGFDFSNDAVTINKLWIQFIKIGGKIGANVFVLISGYFLISAKSLKTNKVIKLWVQIFTYSSVIFALFIATGKEPFGIRELIKHLLPITFSQWWFVSAYFVLYLLSPYINIFLNSLDKKNYQRFLVLLTACWCIVPTLTGKSFESNNLLWFVYLYACAGYIRLYNPKTNVKGIIYILLSFLVTVLTFCSVIVFDVLGTKISFFRDNPTLFYGMQMLPILIISVLMFIGFKKISVRQSRIINLISSATFGVYLIHDAGYVRLFLWRTIFRSASYSDSNFLILYSFVVIATVFVICTFVELIRIYFLEKHYLSFIDSIAEKIDNCKEKFFSFSFFDKI